MYVIVNETVLRRLSDGCEFPRDPGNTDYQGFLRWQAQGNTPLTAPTPTLDIAKAARLHIVNVACDAAINSIRVTYPETEVLSWPKQEAEARTLQADPAAATPLIDAIAAGRQMDRMELASRILQKADAFAVISGAAIGKRQALEDQIAAATSIEALDAITW
ncbi:MAG TPA: hypothetical protein VIM12_05925 [Noviherbaspirillum sp.]|jgi:hypothetical protein|uniref:hypothetical protein n=1 Tax=Noviherbaspirillum sp. TaxID=1926288 RepID=UPI002F9534C7